ncbi:MAG TPA: phosphoribosylaminoimidazolesuccinocarboxamide synthase, partial [Methylomirabilota bacterium]|nr:phosphoribosylaminoimidazolesuccinocarboxamide synthase [Methylomirabilota bacterium]
VPDPNASAGQRAEPFKVEMVVRGCLIGHAWREYKAGKRELCGAAMPDGLNEYDAFPEPLVTPSTKADEGHDEDITPEEIIKRGLATEGEWRQLTDYALKLFGRGQEMAAGQGLVLADTKYEFGQVDGKIILIDEIHTPDSSRYFYRYSYDRYLQDRSQPLPKHLSKEFVREWLMENGFDGHGQPLPVMTDKFVQQVSERYIELFEQVSGQKFKPAANDKIKDRIEANITTYLEANA